MRAYIGDISPIYMENFILDSNFIKTPLKQKDRLTYIYIFFLFIYFFIIKHVIFKVLLILSYWVVLGIKLKLNIDQMAQTMCSSGTHNIFIRCWMCIMISYVVTSEKKCLYFNLLDLFILIILISYLCMLKKVIYDLKQVS